MPTILAAQTRDDRVREIKPKEGERDKVRVRVNVREKVVCELERRSFVLLSTYCLQIFFFFFPLY